MFRKAVTNSREKNRVAISSNKRHTHTKWQINQQQQFSFIERQNNERQKDEKELKTNKRTIEASAKEENPNRSNLARCKTLPYTFYICVLGVNKKTQKTPTWQLVAYIQQQALR